MKLPHSNNDKVKPLNLSQMFSFCLFFHTRFKVINVRESRNQSYPSFVLRTFLCCAFSYRVWGKNNTSVAVTLQRLLKPDRAQWFLGNTAKGGHQISAKNARKQWNFMEDNRLICGVNDCPRSPIKPVYKAKQRKIFNSSLKTNVN